MHIRHTFYILLAGKSSIFVAKKNKKTTNYMYIYLERILIIILTIYHSNNCDGTLYSQEIVRIKKVFNKEGWIVAN